MKKFSKITGEKVTEQKPVEIKTTEVDLMKAGIMKLIDSYIGIKMYGPVTRHERAGSVKIDGKEIFVEALIDFLEDFTSKDKVKLLENLKSESKDWQLIDEKIDQIKSSQEEISESKLIPHKQKVLSMIKRYTSKDDLNNYIDSTIMKVDEESRLLRSISAKRMNNSNNELLTLIEERYRNYTSKI